MAGAGGPKKFRKNLTVQKNVAQCRNYPIPYFDTLSRTIPYLNTSSRTIPFVNTIRKNPNLAQNQFFVGIQSESSITVPKNTRGLSARVEDPSRLSAPLGSL